MDPLFESFLRQEATADVRRMLLAAIVAANTDPSISRRSFEFNVFDIEFNFESGNVTIADALAQAKETIVPLSQFAHALRS